MPVRPCGKFASRNRYAALSRDLQRKAAREQIAGLRQHVSDLVKCFTEHLSQEAHEKGVRVEELCPCYTETVEKAKDYLRRTAA